MTKVEGVNHWEETHFTKCPDCGGENFLMGPSGVCPKTSLVRDVVVGSTTWDHSEWNGLTMI